MSLLANSGILRKMLSMYISRPLSSHHLLQFTKEVASGLFMSPHLPYYWMQFAFCFLGFTVHEFFYWALVSCLNVLSCHETYLHCFVKCHICVLSCTSNLHVCACIHVICDGCTCLLILFSFLHMHAHTHTRVHTHTHS